MTKEEAKKLLYVFLKRHGIAERYYYNCIVYNACVYYDYRKKFLDKPKRERLKLIIEDHIRIYLNGRSKNLTGFFNQSDHTFIWSRSKEGYDYWSRWYFLWRKEIKKYTGEMIELK